MDQEVYDVVTAALADREDQSGVNELAMLMAFHYPETGRALLTKLGALQPRED
jgi:hypothetical protein